MSGRESQSIDEVRMSRFDPDEHSKSAVTILEGFICPMCQLDCSSIDQLQEHFYSVHNQSNEAPAASNSNPFLTGNNDRLQYEKNLSSR